MKLWRIATETREYGADDLSGAGAAKQAGRWNSKGENVIYCAPTIAMAVLETAAHVDDNGLPMNKYLIEIEVSDTVWHAREITLVAALPATWNAIPSGRASANVGGTWLKAAKHLAMEVPSVIVPEEPTVLLNPAHPDFAGNVSAKVIRKFEYDQLFRPATPPPR